MAQFPMLPFYPDAFLGDTTHLSAAEVGAYCLMLMAAWRTRECGLPDDDAMLAKISRLGARQWRKSRATLMAFWHAEPDGMLHQKRLDIERKKAFLFSETQRQRSLKRWRNNSLENNDSNDAADDPPQSPREAIPTRRESLLSPSPRFSLSKEGEKDSQKPRGHTRGNGSSEKWRQQLEETRDVDLSDPEDESPGLALTHRGEDERK